MQINQHTIFNLEFRDNQKCYVTVHTHVDPVSSLRSNDTKGRWFTPSSRLLLITFLWEECLFSSPLFLRIFIRSLNAWIELQENWTLVQNGRLDRARDGVRATSFSFAEKNRGAVDIF